MMIVLSGLILFYYALTIASFWAPLAAASSSRLAKALPPNVPDNQLPRLIAISPTRSSPESVRGMAAALGRQNYPANRFRRIILIDSDGPNDPSADYARSEGAEVYERRNPEVKTKGGAVNELIQTLRKDNFDAIIVLDIDARVAPEFLRRVAAHLATGAQAIQGAPASKNPEETIVARISHAAQSLSQLIQAGRSALGLQAILSGTGMVFTRQMLEQLNWKTSSGKRISDDGELNIRCHELGIKVAYGADLILRNDLPTDRKAVRLQRIRWNAAYIEMGMGYIGRLLMRKIAAGEWRSVEGIFNLALLPSCSLSFVLGALGVVMWSALAVHDPKWLTIAILSITLWTLHILYYFFALREVNCRLSSADLARLPAFLVVRLIAIIQGGLLAFHPDPGRKATPSTHKEMS